MIINHTHAKVRLLTAIGVDNSALEFEKINQLAKKMTDENDYMTYIHQAFYCIYRKDGPYYVEDMLQELTELELTEWFHE